MKVIYQKMAFDLTCYGWVPLCRTCICGRQLFPTRYSHCSGRLQCSPWAERNWLQQRDLGKSHRLRISDSWYQHSNLHRWTRNKNIIFVNIRWMILQNYRVTGVLFYHRMLVVTIRVHFKILCQVNTQGCFNRPDRGGIVAGGLTIFD